MAELSTIKYATHDVKNELNKKTNTILSKMQLVIDKINSVSSVVENCSR